MLKKLVLAACLLSSCSTPARTRWNEVAMRVMVDPDSVPESQYTVLVRSLMQSKNWTVVDRARGWLAVKQEQERMHRTESDRYDNRQKWAMWGKMYGVGGVIVAAAECEEKRTFFFSKRYLTCAQSLSLVDANNGEIIAVSSDVVDGSTDLVYVPPTWSVAVDRLTESFPKDYRKREFSENINTYMEQAEEHAKQQQVQDARMPASDASQEDEPLDE